MEQVEDLADLPMPAWDLFDLQRYARSQPLWRAAPVGNIETSRGCPHRCSFCVSNLVFGTRIRFKPAQRVLEEIRLMRELGFGEIHIQDDGFSEDPRRAREICEGLIAAPDRFPWELYNGVRIDRVDDGLLGLAVRAGCYRLRVGAESADAEVLRRVGKGFEAGDLEEAFALMRRHPIETLAMFVFGLPGDTPESLAATTRFAVRLRPDLAKVSIATPFPGSRLFEELEREGRILTRDWNQYYLHNTEQPLFENPGLPFEALISEYQRFYGRFYLRPAYVARRVRRGLRHGHFLSDARYFYRHFLPWSTRP